MAGGKEGALFSSYPGNHKHNNLHVLTYRLFFHQFLYECFSQKFFTYIHEKQNMKLIIVNSHNCLTYFGIWLFNLNHDLTRQGQCLSCFLWHPGTRRQMPLVQGTLVWNPRLVLFACQGQILFQDSIYGIQPCGSRVTV